MRSDLVCFGRYIPTFGMNLIVCLFDYMYLPHVNVTLSYKKLLYHFWFLKYLAAGNLSLSGYVKFVFKFFKPYLSVKQNYAFGNQEIKPQVLA
jgi:hypothetical protein